MNQSLIAHDVQPSQPARYLRRLETPAHSFDDLAERVEEKHRAFARRVAHEEGRCGFFVYLAAAAPRYHVVLEHLHADHRYLASAFASLRAKIRHADADQWEELVAELDAIDTAVADHETFEREVLRDAQDPP